MRKNKSFDSSLVLIFKAEYSQTEEGGGGGRETETERQRQRDRKRQRDRQRETDRETERDRGTMRVYHLSRCSLEEIPYSVQIPHS